MGKHLDKYANLRKNSGDRGHYNSDGTPKRTLTEEVANGTVVWLQETRGHLANAYRCETCCGWHVGRRNNSDRQSDGRI